MGAVRSKLRDPVFWLDTTQVLKTVAAAVIAWLLAGHVFGIAQSFLAPWAALLTVHATVYRTLERGPSRSAPRCSACCSPSRSATSPGSGRCRSR